jgi:hypothetical protein
MWVLVILGIFVGPGMDQNLYPITRQQVDTYPSKAACDADAQKQMAIFAAGLPGKPAFLKSTCVEITGPAGTPS